VDPEKYNRSVSMLCPTCGLDQFATREGSVDDALLVTCTSCGLEITKDDLVRANSENIDEQLNEVKEQLARDVEQELKKSLGDAFKGNKYIKIK